MSITANRQLVLPKIPNDISESLKSYLHDLESDLLANQRQIFDSLLFLNFEIASSISTFTAGDTTPSVSKGIIFKTANTSETIITMFDDGTTGQRIIVIFADSFTVIDFTGTNLKGNKGINAAFASGDHMECVFDGTNWYCAVHKNTDEY